MNNPIMVSRKRSRWRRKKIFIWLFNHGRSRKNERTGERKKGEEKREIERAGSRRNRGYNIP